MTEMVEKKVVEPPSSYKSNVWKYFGFYNQSISTAKKEITKENKTFCDQSSDSLPQYIHVCCCCARLFYLRSPILWRVTFPDPRLQIVVGRPLVLGYFD